MACIKLSAEEMFINDLPESYFKDNECLDPN